MTSSADFWVGPVDRPTTYRLVAMLGSGGEGTVWRAVLPLSDGGRRDVAIKVLSGAATDDAEWSRYGHLLTSLAHPGLVRVTDVFTGPAMHRVDEACGGELYRYVVMDYVEGTTLLDWVLDNEDLSASRRLGTLRTVAAALDALHNGANTQMSVAHGDVKPANIIITPDSGTVLVDLGLVRLADAAGVSGRTKPYAAPEMRIPGALPTAQADNFAFMVTIAHALTGAPPPTDAAGYLDLAALHHQLLASPITQRRPAPYSWVDDRVERTRRTPAVAAAAVARRSAQQPLASHRPLLGGGRRTGNPARIRRGDRRVSGDCAKTHASWPDQRPRGCGRRRGGSYQPRRRVVPFTLGTSNGQQYLAGVAKVVA